MWEKYAPETDRRLEDAGLQKLGRTEKFQLFDFGAAFSILRSR